MTLSRFDGRVPGLVAAAALLAGCAGTQPAIPAPSNALLAPPLVATGANAERVLYSFTGQYDGGNAATGLVHDRRGNLYGTTVVGGTAACGTAFQLTPQSAPPWRETVLHSFSCGPDGKNPHGGVTFDGHGNLDGTTVAGGAGGSCTGDGCGVVYQLTSTGENVLHSFTGGPDGYGPGGGVVFDAAGDLFGTTPDGGKYGAGTVYEVSGSGGNRRERVIHAFTGGRDGGVGSLGSLLIDASGNLYGVTEIGGAHGGGTAFELSHGLKGRWNFSTLYAFGGTPDAGSPYGGLVADASGNLYGTTYYGGSAGLGSVFELTPRPRGGYRERVLYSFKGGSDGSSSTATLLRSGSGALYGTTSAGGGSCDCGTIFKVDSTTGKEQVLHAFGSGTDGAYPYYGLTAGAHGMLYGSTVAGGLYGQGTVFGFKP